MACNVTFEWQLGPHTNILNIAYGMIQTFMNGEHTNERTIQMNDRTEKVKRAIRWTSRIGEIAKSVYVCVCYGGENRKQ